MRLFSFVSILVVIGFFADLYITVYGFQFPNHQMIVTRGSNLIKEIMISDRMLIWLIILIVFIGWWDLKKSLRNQDVKLDKTVRLTALDAARRNSNAVTSGVVDENSKIDELAKVER